MLQCPEPALDVRRGLLFAPWPIRGGVCSSVVGVEAMRVRFNQALLPLSVCPAPKEVVAEAGEARVLTEHLCTTCVSIHDSLRSSPRSRPFLHFVRPRSSARLWCGVGWSGGQGIVVAGTEVAVLPPGTRGCLCGRALPAPGHSRSDAKVQCGAGRARVLPPGNHHCILPPRACLTAQDSAPSHCVFSWHCPVCALTVSAAARLATAVRVLTVGFAASPKSHLRPSRLSLCS